jgi:tetratricopeptide (TPR) repeat protein
MPDLIRHPVFFWVPAFAGMTIFDMCYCRINNSMEPSIDIAIKEIHIIKWLLIGLVIIFSIILTEIVFVVFQTIRLAKKQGVILKNFSDQARDLLDKGRTDEVIKLSKERIASHPQDKYAYWYLAMAYQDQKDYVKAIEALNKLIQIAPVWQEEYIDPNIRAIKQILKNTKPEIVQK